MKQTELLAATRETPGVDSEHPVPPLQELSPQAQRAVDKPEVINITN